MVANAFNPSTLEAEARRYLKFEDSLVYRWAPGQLSVHLKRKTLYQNKNKNSKWGSDDQSLECS